MTGSNGSTTPGYYNDPSQGYYDPSKGYWVPPTPARNFTPTPATPDYWTRSNASGGRDQHPIDPRDYDRPSATQAAAAPAATPPPPAPPPPPQPVDPNTGQPARVQTYDYPGPGQPPPAPPPTPGNYTPTPWHQPPPGTATTPRPPPTPGGPQPLTPPYWNRETPRGQPYQAPYQDLISGYARQYGIPPILFNALIRAESGYDPNSLSGTRAAGLGQLEPDTAREMGVTNVYDPSQNLRGSAQYLRQLYDKYGSWQKAVAAYNAGPGGAERNGFSLAGYQGYGDGRELIRIASDPRLPAAGGTAPQNYRPASYNPPGGVMLRDDRPPSEWGKLPPLTGAPGEIPHQREIPGIMSALAPLLAVGLSLFSKGAALPMINFYAGFLNAQNKRQTEDAKLLRTQYQDELKETIARMKEEQLAAAGSMDDPQALQEIALRFNDPQLANLVANGDLKGAGALFQTRDKLYQDLGKTDLAERRFELQQEEFRALEEQRAAQNQRANATSDRERAAADERLRAADEKLKRLRNQEEQFPGSTGGATDGDGASSDQPSGGGQPASGSTAAPPEEPPADGGDGSADQPPDSTAPRSTAPPTAAPPPSRPAAPTPGAGGDGLPPRWGPSGPPSGYKPPSAPAAPPPGQRTEAAPTEDQYIPSGGEPRTTPAAYAGPTPAEQAGRAPIVPASDETVAAPPVPTQPTEAAVESAENNTWKLGRTFLHGGEAPPGMAPGINQAAEVVANNLRTQLNGLATSGLSGQALVDAVRQIDNRSADLLSNVMINREPLPGGQGMGSRLQDYSQMIGQLAYKANPNWDVGQWPAIEDFRKSSGQTQRAIGRITAIGDAGTKLRADLEAIKDNPDVFSRMLEQYRTQGFTDDPAYSNLFTDWQTFIIDSNALTQGGQGLEGETQEMVKSIPLYGQKSAYIGALKRHASFALKRYEQYQNQWGQLQRTDPMFGHNDEAEKQLQDLSSLKEERPSSAGSGGAHTDGDGWKITPVPQ